jgi:glucose/arabinose dehydrogenase
MFLLLGIFAAITLGGVGPQFGGSSTEHVAQGGEQISFVEVVSGLSEPVGLAHAGDERLFIVERAGLIRVYNGFDLLTMPFLNASSLLPAARGPEEGLLGLAFHPNYPSTPHFFVHYTNTSGDIVIARYEVSANPDVADPNSARILLTISHPSHQNHNGGQLGFGPDGYLYIAVGDGGGGGDPGNNSQDISEYLGKLLRIDVNENVNTPPYYGIPPGNPFSGSTPGLDELWAWGLRNPWRFSFDRTTGDLFIADVGQGDREEVDFEPNNSPGGVNYGWRIMEGFTCETAEGVGCFHPSLTPPVLDYDHSSGNCSVTGGYVYRGASSSLAGTYIFGDFCSGRIWATLPGSVPWSKTLLIDTSFLISSFGEDVDGELYFADYSGGTLQRIVFDDDDGDGLSNYVETDTGVYLGPNDTGTDPLNPDTDSDGCSDGEEVGDDESVGGRRNPVDEWDFYDVNGSRNVDGTDVALVKSRFGTYVGHPNYIAAYDRTGGSHPWAPGPPSGMISGTQIALAKASFGHSCIADP